MTVQDDATSGVNDTGTNRKIDAPVTQPRSRSVPGPHKGFTYFVRDADMIKIGSSMRPVDRINSLQTGSSRPLKTLAIVPMEIADEFETHQRFAHLRVRGEWFRAEPDLLQFIELIADTPWSTTKAPAEMKATKEPTMIEKLHALRRAHGMTSAVGYHCSNLIELLQLPELPKDMIRRQLKGLDRLRAGLQ